MIVICFDGSSAAEAAIDRAAEVMPGAEATVLTVWRPFIEPPSAAGRFPGLVEHRHEITEATRQHAEALAKRGESLARAAGLTATGAARVEDRSCVDTILATADALEASLIVVGSRGLGPVRGSLLGSVSHALLHTAQRPVLVVPAAVADRSRNGAAAGAAVA